MKEYSKKAGCHPKRCSMADWKWKKVNIWQHQWLPRKHPPLVCSPMVPSMEEAIANLLIEVSTR